MPSLSRRTVLHGTVGLVGVAAVGSVAACSTDPRTLALIGPDSPAVAAAERARRVAGRRVVTAGLTARPVTVDLGGQSVDTWAYGEQVPGPLLRARAGDLLQVTVDNQLPVETSVHWHGLALRNDMDGVPHLTQDPIPAGGSFNYEFIAPDPGTYFYHPHSGVQLDRGLYGVLIVDDPAEPGGYDDEWIVVLDDWVDGTGRTPDQVLADLQKATSTSGGAMGGMDHGSMGRSMGGTDHGSGMGGMAEGMQSLMLGGAGDVDYPYYLINGRTPSAPHTFTGRPGQRVRIRFVNAGSDTAFRVAVGGHRMTVSHCDGFPVMPVSTDALLIGMGERVDVTIDLADGVFPLVAAAEGKTGRALALVRTSPGGRPARDVGVPELGRRTLLGSDLSGAASVRLGGRGVDRRYDLALGGSMAPYRWTINGESFPDATPLSVSAGERVRLRFVNQTMMFHPMHLHGHTFGLVDGGARKDTVIVRPMQALEVDVDADNPGQWAVHCHNIYHAETGMMTTLSYRSGG
ncbi:Multicopper oxidase with three cupredoxin domains (includes cell division protein FtsP and spore coat protein CotA) [Nocardioides szechwanensis]|uniref:Multicopper oxidase with three cupredoxin domains (Includes cell division protein FtsP and spore coat protein CotA) n=1 Tax=Nocardioides szechwanensis TaxID=1005944 RepID=A0A1H0K6A0_9ACTN|nr:multicopper oxidase family protein [Nocardioides szechwanensis]SDO51231.1 Multicopper oxidase with three cupredoxin domains (includes cell division protein FtsP and spore coat protein CotA) [Nocardioides szechwanensis]